MGRFKEAIECFKKLIDELNVRWIDAIRHAVSLMLLIDDNLKDVERYINMGLKIKEDDVALWYYKGELYQKLDKLEEALKCYDRVIELQPNYIRALLNKARIYERQGDLEKAVEYYNKAVENMNRDYDQ